MPRHPQTQPRQGAHGPGHQALPAGLVDGGRPGFGHDDVEAGARRVERGGQPGRSASGDHQVVAAAAHAGAAEARAAFSQRTRTVSSRALAAENTAAVTHAECTRGSAATSTTTTA